MNGDKSGESGVFLFSRRVPDFCDGRRSFPTNENSNLYRRGRRCPSAMDFAHYQCPKLLGSSPRHINNLENLGQISGEYPIYRQNLGWSAKSNIPDRLGFSRHMKTRLNIIRHYTIHYTSQSFLPTIVSFKGSCKHAQRIVERSHKHPHKF